MRKKINNAIENIKNGNLAEFKRPILIGFAVVLAGLLGNVLFTFLTTDRAILRSLQEFNVAHLLLAACLALVPWMTNTLRVMIWTRFLKHHFSFANILKITISTELGSALSPTAIGGGYLKAGMLMRQGLTAGKATSLLTLGSVENGLFFLFALPTAVYVSKCWNLPVIGQILEHFQKNIIIVLFIILAAILVGMLFHFMLKNKTKKKNEKSALTFLRNKAKKFRHDFISVYKLIGKNGKSRFALSMLLTAIQWISRYSILTAMLLSLGIKTNPVLIFLLQWVTFTLMTFIPTPGAAVGAEASFYTVYASLIPKEYLGFMTAGWRFLTFYFTILLGLFTLSIFYIGDHILKQKSKRDRIAQIPITTKLDLAK